MNETATSVHPYPTIGLLLALASSVEGRVDGALAEVGLSLAKVGVLRHLAESDDPLPLSRLSGMCGCVKSNITQLVDRLEADGLVARVPDPDDRRSVRAVLTPLGRDRYDQGAAILTQHNQALTSALSSGGCGELIESLQRMVR